MILKIILLTVLCLIPTHSYTEENGVLVLTDEDLQNITDIYPHLFVKYYVPWYTCDNKGADIASN
jgi:hypothetical protein